MALDWVLLAVAAATLVYVYLTWTHGYWKKRGVPFDSPNMIFGSYKDVLLMKTTMGEVIREIYKRTAGNRYVGYFQFRKPVLLIRDPELIKAVLVKDFNSFQNNTFVIDETLDPLLARNPFFRTGEKWKQVRSQLSPAFTSGKIKPMFPFIVNVCKEFKEYLEEEAPRNRPDGLETKEVAGKFTTEVVASCAFGIHGNSFKDHDAELRKMGRQILMPTMWKNLLFMISLFFPVIGSLFRVRFMELHIANFFRKIVKEVVTHRETLGVIKNDFLQLLLTLKRRGQLEEVGAVTGVDSKTIKSDYTDEDITAHAITFFTDGFETSSIVLSFALYDLAVNQAVQDRLRKEVDTVLKKYGGELCYDAVNEMSYLEMVFSETLRLHPPAMSTEKLCTKPYELPTPNGDTLTVEVGTPVVIPIMALHLDEEYFPEPDKFDPERFGEENKANINRYAYLPFGLGPRQCLGMKFAQSQVKAGIANVVANFQVKTTQKTPIPVVQDPHYFLACAKGGLWLDFVKRN